LGGTVLRPPKLTPQWGQEFVQRRDERAPRELEPNLQGFFKPGLERVLQLLTHAVRHVRVQAAHPADRWTWLVIAAYAQLWLARDLAADIRLPWQQPCPPGRLTPSRVRRGFRRIRQDLPVPASAPKPSWPGPGRPAGSKNQRPAIRYDVGKTVKREEPEKKTRRQAG
jgi:hypothetical protein